MIIFENITGVASYILQLDNKLILLARLCLADTSLPRRLCKAALSIGNSGKHFASSNFMVQRACTRCWTFSRKLVLPSVAGHLWRPEWKDGKVMTYCLWGGLWIRVLLGSIPSTQQSVDTTPVARLCTGGSCVCVCGGAFLAQTALISVYTRPIYYPKEILLEWGGRRVLEIPFNFVIC